jgi:hypothetical protein
MPCEFKIDGVQEGCQFDISEDSLMDSGSASPKRCIFHAPQNWEFPSGTTKDDLSAEEKEYFFGSLLSG